MAVMVSGLETSYGDCSSLILLEQSIHHNKPCGDHKEGDPIQSASNALRDAALKGTFHLGILSNDPGLLLNSGIPVFEQATQIGTEESGKGAIFQAIQIADNWIGEHPNRVVLLMISTSIGTGCMLLVHPDREIPSYAKVEVVPENQRVNNELFSNPIGYLELIGGLHDISQEQFDVLGKLFDSGAQHPEIALGSIFPTVVDESGLAELSRASLVLSRKVIPGNSDHLDQDIVHSGGGKPFYVPEYSRPWLDHGNGYQRFALVIQTAPEPGIWKFLKLSEAANPKILPPARPYLTGTEPILIPVGGSSSSDLINQIQTLKTELRNEKPLKNIAKDAYTKISEGLKPSFICTFMGTSREDFLKEITHAKIGIPGAFETNKSWISPKGSYFTPHPLGEKGIAFVYPGAFNSYPGMGRKLFDYFPPLHNLVKQIIKNASHSLAEKILYPRYLDLEYGNKKTDPMQDLYNHPSELIESGISISVLHTLILKNLFQISPDAAFGYSLGESSMLWANNIWKNVETSSESWKNSSLFQTQLFGPMNTVRDYWKDEILAEEFWGSFILKAPVSKVEKALEGESQVFLTIINTDDEVVIAGKQDACQRIIAKLACHALPMPFNAAIHNPAMESVYPDFVDLYTHGSQTSPKMIYYSAAEYEPLILETDNLSRAMAKMTCSPVDFPRLVNRVYQDGIRIFIEVGPQKTCSRWIEKILNSQPHAVIPINKKHQSDYEGVLKVLSLLISHQVPVDLNILYQDEMEISQEFSSSNGRSRNKIKNSTDKKIRISQLHISKTPAESHAEYGSINASQHTNYLENLTRLSADTAKSHQHFLDNQQVLTRNLARVVKMRSDPSSSRMGPIYNAEPLYTRNQIISFTEGNHQDCFGDTFDSFEDRRIPRLPNGNLRFLDRIMDIQGEAEKVKVGSSLVSEYDLPTQAWYLKPQDTTLPYVSLMELALQPCGFLSAYMGSIKDMSDLDLYFRNLDGKGILSQWPDILGHTLTNRVELLSTSKLQNVIIQEYSFELSSRGRIFYQGKSSFGYFPLPMLLNQSGLDGNQTIAPWMDTNLKDGKWVEFSSLSVSSQKPEQPGVPEINKIWISPTGGNYQKGYIFSEQIIPPNSWFYEAHFYQDPVMPGSLGVETIAQAIIKSTPDLGLPENKHWRIKPGTNTSWKYRGQITREVKGIKFDFHIKDIINGDHGWQIIGDGNLWKEDVRIYQVTDLSLESY